jgi:RNA polymerase sigma-70 factor, ECF subfamily
MTDPLAEHRPLAVAVAYRMLGSVADAEDVAQETLLRVHRQLSAGTELTSPRGFVTAVATRLSIDRLRREQRRREEYIGPWLPEPMLVDTTVDVAGAAELADSLSTAFLVVLERLNPVERAVFLLRDVFDLPFAEVADVVGRSETNCRQILVRARRHVHDDRSRFATSGADRDALATRFFAAAQEGDVAGLVAMLAEDATLTGDGGGKAMAFTEPLSGATTIARVLSAIFRRGRALGAQTELVAFNGQTGLLGRDPEGRIVFAMTLDIAEGRVEGILSLVNPDKLAHLGPVSDLGLRGWRGN